jgi:hypothetical protein
VLQAVGGLPPPARGWICSSTCWICTSRAGLRPPLGMPPWGRGAASSFFSGCRAPRRPPESRSAVLLAGSTYPPAGSALPQPVCTCLVVPPCGVPPRDTATGPLRGGRRLAPPPALIVWFVLGPTVPGLAGGRPWVMVEGLQAKAVGPLVAR